ncbi:MAG TPA: sigma factor [Opitutales bacterium]|nr:sigma factor [Opitutales bacterium]
MEKNSIVQDSTRNRQTVDELQMIKAARMDVKSFGELYELYVEKVFRYLYGRIGNLHDAEDVTAQTFLAAFESNETTSTADNKRITLSRSRTPPVWKTPAHNSDSTTDEIEICQPRK